MAKRKETTVDFREVVIKLHCVGKSLGEISSITDKSKSTIQHIVETLKKQVKPLIIK